MIKKGDMLILAVIMILFGFNGTLIAETKQKTDNLQKQSNKSEPTPSLEETMKWIKGRLEAKSGLYYMKKNDDKSATITHASGTGKFDYDGCKVAVENFIVESREWNNLKSETTNSTIYIQFNLKDMSTVNIEEFSASDGDKSLCVKLETLNSERLISRKATVVRYYDGNEADAKKEEFNAFDSLICFELELSEKGLAERLLKAFNHAILLCGGKKKPF